MLEDWIYDPRVLAVMQRGVRQPASRCPTRCSAKAEAAKHHGKGCSTRASGSMRPSTWRCMAPTRPSRWRCGRAWKAPRRSATCPAACSRPASPMSPPATAPATTATCGARWWRPTCAPPSRTTGSIPRSGSATAAPSWPTARRCTPDELVRRFLGRDSNPQAFFDELQRGAQLKPPPRGALQHVGGEVGQARALAARQRHVARCGQPLKRSTA